MMMTTWNALRLLVVLAVLGAAIIALVLGCDLDASSAKAEPESRCVRIGDSPLDSYGIHRCTFSDDGVACYVSRHGMSCLHR